MKKIVNNTKKSNESSPVRTVRKIATNGKLNINLIDQGVVGQFSLANNANSIVDPIANLFSTDNRINGIE